MKIINKLQKYQEDDGKLTDLKLGVKLKYFETPLCKPRKLFGRAKCNKLFLKKYENEHSTESSNKRLKEYSHEKDLNTDEKKTNSQNKLD